MKPILIKIFIGVAGFAGGFASGYLVHKRMNNIQFEEVTEEEMNEIEKTHSSYSNLSQEEKTNTSEEVGAAQELPEKPDDIRNELQGKTPFIKADSDTKKAYEKLWKATSEYSTEDNANQYPVWRFDKNAVMGSENDAEKSSEKGTDEAEDDLEDGIDEDFIDQLGEEADSAENNFEDPPHQIDLIAFYNDNPDWDSVTIHFYMDDNTWVDENEEVIPDIASYTGMKNVNPFNEEPIDDDPDVRFWANPFYKTNYEFIRHHRSWGEENGEVN